MNDAAAKPKRRLNEMGQPETDVFIDAFVRLWATPIPLFVEANAELERNPRKRTKFWTIRCIGLFILGLFWGFSRDWIDGAEPHWTHLSRRAVVVVLGMLILASGWFVSAKIVLADRS